MPEHPSVETDVETAPARPQIRRIHSSVLGPTRTPRVNLAILVVAFALVAFLVYHFFFAHGSRVHADVVDLTRSIERVEELATLKSHLRFAVVVREESGNIIVRRLAEQSDDVGMSTISSMLFQDPTMIVELHGVATYGVRLKGIGERITATDSSVAITLPAAEVLDVKLVSDDTRIVAQMKGLFRSNNQALLGEANRHGERFVRELAAADTTLLALASERARSLVGMIVEQSGGRPEFR